MDERVLRPNPPRKSDRYSPWNPEDQSDNKPSLTASGEVEISTAVSLIIPTFFNEALKGDSFELMLKGLESSQAIKEVILVSSDGEPHDFSPLRGLIGDKLLRIVHSEPQNRAKSRNIGIQAATSDHVVFMDDDMLLTDWRMVDVIVSNLLKGEFEAAMFPRRCYAKFPLLYDRPFLEEVIALWRTQEDYLENPFLHDPVIQGNAFKTMYYCFPGCFMLIRKDAYNRMDGFPESFQGWGFEDTDFAIRAISNLRILNLFGKSSPLLHIDHPVSPYKTEEHDDNYHKFVESFSQIEVDMLCKRVYTGADFSGKDMTETLSRTEDYLAPLFSLEKTQPIPVDSDEFRQSYLRIIERRLKFSLTPYPEHIILHGSSGKGSSLPARDLDYLVLFRGGAGTLQEFFVLLGEVPIDIEYAEIEKFEDVTENPSQYPLNGPLELTKITEGIPVWGDHQVWQHWQQQIITVALESSKLHWMVTALGLQLAKAKYGPYVDRYFKSLIGILSKSSNSEETAADIACLKDSCCQALGEYVVCLLNAEIPEWSEKTRHGQKLFDNQVPEVWYALQWMIKHH